MPNANFLLRAFLLLATLFVCAQGRVCNGHESLCARSYSNVSFVGAYNSYPVCAGYCPSANQHISVKDQLNAGFRVLQAQVHQERNSLYLCHTSCALYDGGTLLAFLTTVKTWLDAHPTEVVTLLFTNPDNVAPSVWAPIFVSAGMANYASVPPAAKVAWGNWPTLGGLIDSGKRAVVFMDYGANFASVPYILDEFSMIWETPYGSSFPCTVDRISGSTSDHMYLINHSLSFEIFGIFLPDVAKISKTNAASGAGSLGMDADNCASKFGRPPNILLVDFIDKGNVFAVANRLNGVA